MKINPNFSKNYCQIFLKNCAKGTVWKILTCITQLFNVNIRPEILAKVIPSTFILWAITVSLTFWSQFDIASEQDVVWDPEIWVNSIKNWFNFFKRTDKKTSRKEGIESSKRVFIYLFSLHSNTLFIRKQERLENAFFFYIPTIIFSKIIFKWQPGMANIVSIILFSLYWCKEVGVYQSGAA